VRRKPQKNRGLYRCAIAGCKRRGIEIRKMVKMKIIFIIMMTGAVNIAIGGGEDTHIDQLSSREKLKMSKTKQAAVETMRTFMTYVRSGEFDKAEKCLSAILRRWSCPRPVRTRR